MYGGPAELQGGFEKMNREGREGREGKAFDPVSHAIIGAAIEVHRELGPGLLESTYSVCLAHELRQRSLDVQRELPFPVRYKGIQIDLGYRIDLLVDGRVIVELKSVERIEPVHRAQIILSYLKLTGLQIGLLINFNVPVLREGAHRFVLRAET